MARAKTVGYVVLNANDHPQEFVLNPYGDSPKHKVLVHSGNGTLFKHRETAKRAITRTAKYANARGYDQWKVNQFSVARIVR